MLTKLNNLGGVPALKVTVPLGTLLEKYLYSEDILLTSKYKLIIFRRYASREIK